MKSIESERKSVTLSPATPTVFMSIDTNQTNVVIGSPAVDKNSDINDVNDYDKDLVNLKLPIFIK